MTEDRPVEIEMRLSRLPAAIGVAATLLTAAAPAEAQRWGGRGYGYRHRGGDTFGNLLLGGLIGGVIVAAVSANNRHKTVETIGDAGPLPAPPIAPLGEYDGPGGRPALADIGSQGEAVDLCTAAAEDDARAALDHVSHVRREGDVWRVDGRVDARRRGEGDFTCTAGRGRVMNLRFLSGAASPAF